MDAAALEGPLKQVSGSAAWFPQSEKLVVQLMKKDFLAGRERVGGRAGKNEKIVNHRAFPFSAVLHSPRTSG